MSEKVLIRAHIQRYYRSRLDEHDRKIYDMLVQHWMDMEKKESLRIAKPHVSLATLRDAIKYDYPLLFYVDWTINLVEDPYGMRVNCDYRYPIEEARRLLKRCDQWARNVVASIPAQVTRPVDKALYLHDFLTANVRYGHTQGRREYTMIGVVEDRVAVCDGISLAYKCLCDFADVPCICVLGELNGGGHAWNLLWVDGGASFVDVTNDIRGEYTRHHFLRKATEMPGYTWDASKIPESNRRNLRNLFEEARSEEELLAIVLKNKDCESLEIHLKFGRKLTDREINLLGNKIRAQAPYLAQRTIQYSGDSQVLYIEK